MSKEKADNERRLLEKEKAIFKNGWRDILPEYQQVLGYINSEKYNIPEYTQQSSSSSSNSGGSKSSRSDNSSSIKPTDHEFFSPIHAPINWQISVSQGLRKKMEDYYNNFEKIKKEIEDLDSEKRKLQMIARNIDSERKFKLNLQQLVTFGFEDLEIQ